MVAAAVIGGAVVGGFASSKAAGKAADAQKDASNSSIAFQRESRDLALAYQAPFRQAGYAATAAAMDLTGLSRKGFAKSTNPDVPSLGSFSKYNFKADPGYQFRLAEGNRNLERGAAARGGLLSGGYGRKAIRYAQDYASNEYQNVYNRIASIAGFGQSATNASTNIIYGTGQGVGSAMINAGEARGSAYIAQGNAWANAANQIGTYYGYQGSGAPGGGMGNQAINYGGPLYGGGLA